MLQRPTIYCPICKTDPGYIQTTHLILEEATSPSTGHGTGDLISRDCMDLVTLAPEERFDEITIHPYCWAIVKRVFRKPGGYDQEWIEGFKERLELLTDVIVKAPFQDEADKLDGDVFAVLRPGLSTTGTGTGSTPGRMRGGDGGESEGSSAGNSTFAFKGSDYYTRIQVQGTRTASGTLQTRTNLTTLPVEIIYQIYALLDTEEDTVNLADAIIHTGPPPEFWKTRAEKYMLAADLDARVNVSTILRNVQKRPAERYPRTSNYRVIWDNMEAVRDKMEDSMRVVWLGESPGEDHDGGGHVTSGGGDGGYGGYDSEYGYGYGYGYRDGKYQVELPRDNKMIVHLMFADDERTFRRTLCGMAFNGAVIGEKGVWAEKIDVCGLREIVVAYDRSPRSPGRCVGVIFLNAEGEKRGGRFPSGCGYTRFDWNGRCRLLVELERSRIINLGCRYSSSLSAATATATSSGLDDQWAIAELPKAIATIPLQTS